MNNKRPKSGGRTKGTPNKVTGELRELITDFLQNNWERVQSDFDNLEPKDRLVFYERLLTYSTPKLQSVDNTLINKMDMPIIIYPTSENEVY